MALADPGRVGAGERQRHQGEREKHRHQDEQTEPAGIVDADQELPESGPSHSHHHVGGEDPTPVTVVGYLVQPAFGGDEDARHTEAAQNPQNEPSDRIQIQDVQGRGRGRQSGKHPHMAYMGEHGADCLASHQAACVIAGQGDPDGQRGEVFDGGADPQEGSAETVADPQDARGRKQRSQVFLFSWGNGHSVRRTPLFVGLSGRLVVLETGWLLVRRLTSLKGR